MQAGSTVESQADKLKSPKNDICHNSSFKIN